MTGLLSKKCVPCEGGEPPLPRAKVEELLKEVPEWQLNDNGWVVREWKFKNFKQAVAFVNKVAELAESEGHHPNFYLHSWNKLRLELYTHAINGLSENDFIMAAKISKLDEKRGAGTALASEKALAKTWNAKKEDAAWKDL